MRGYKLPEGHWLYWYNGLPIVVAPNQDVILGSIENVSKYKVCHYIAVDYESGQAIALVEKEQE